MFTKNELIEKRLATHNAKSKTEKVIITNHGEYKLTHWVAVENHDDKKTEPEKLRSWSSRKFAETTVTASDIKKAKSNPMVTIMANHGEKAHVTLGTGDFGENPCHKVITDPTPKIGDVVITHPPITPKGKIVEIKSLEPKLHTMIMELNGPGLSDLDKKWLEKTKAS